ncbi:MAG: type IV toxin-antitoxin system AbiEi family antitoxin domain-containing protein [Kineosporiaceae bacterium]|nr:type IV toxin-antitoxin system AbiEi family antitoxin domain-containing protein [Kineosporiaceae bacterium]
MFPRAAIPPSALGLARHQAGVISRAQLLELGLSRRAIDRLSGDRLSGDRLSGGCSRVVRGVYLIRPPFGEVPWLARVWAGLLLGGSGARAGMFTAAILDRLASPGELVRGHDVGDEHQVTIFVGGRPMPQPGFTFLREQRGLRLPVGARAGPDPDRGHRARPGWCR